ncbi:protein LURP-one-related 8-like isoform X2 [Phoenix dactylifera]|uniref:Protein LURP-one-related 8-like isoform X2 n=1 Tax=Phoenix dactylifera TaxID=42345 RepID=A0A8B8IYK6_PHODC|nr:protein LURP-one-related 8-like isoform X2 [Phoenix dactylifera]
METSEGKEAPMEDWSNIGAGEPAGSPRGVFPELCSPYPVQLTVWCRSLLFNGHGYTVFDDSDGRMVFRVDNYAHNWRQEAVLMDRAGNVLLTIRRCRKILNLMESWEAYKGDKDGLGMVGHQRPLFKATKELGAPSCTVSMVRTRGMEPLGYRMCWSRQNEWSKIYEAAANAPLVAEHYICLVG